MRYFILFLLPLMAACAKSTKEITPHYVSPMQYNHYNCRQLEREMQVLSRRVSELGGQVDQVASDDNAQMAVGLIIFWPALFFLDGDTPQATEYARLKGEFEAIERASIEKDCSFKIERPVTPKPVEEKESPKYPSSKR